MTRPYCCQAAGATATSAQPVRKGASWWTRGSVTIEAAFAISAMLIVIGVVVAGMVAVAGQIAATEASAQVARAVARGEDRSEVERRVAGGLTKATIEVSTIPGSGGQPGFVVATVTVENAVRDAKSTSVAVNEENIGSSGDAG